MNVLVVDPGSRAGAWCDASGGREIELDTSLPHSRRVIACVSFMSPQGRVGTVRQKDAPFRRR
jgi:hypothetical protein